MHPFMTFQRQLVLPCWDVRVSRIALEYVRSRGFSDAEVLPGGRGPIITGKRGSWLGNLTSFDMKKLRAKIRLVGEATGEVRVELAVCTFGQQITQWNRAVWRLELIELRRVLLGLGPIDDVWSRFDRDSRSAAILWTFTAARGGQRLSDAWEAELRELESTTAAD
jgi:hypothetical protein